MASLSSPVKPVVLVVEDEPILRLHAVDIVEDAGFEVLEASNADEAIEILNARGDVRVVFTDIDMPGSMDGIRLAAAIRDRWPPIELILTSGHVKLGDSDIPERGLFFSKPYRTADIQHAISGFLSG